MIFMSIQENKNVVFVCLKPYRGKQYLPRKSKEKRIATIWVMPVCVTDVLKYKGEAAIAMAFNQSIYLQRMS